MLSHSHASPIAPARAVVLGAAGFVGKASADRLEAHGVETVRLARRDVDLLADGAAERLSVLLRSDDALVVVAARAPCKTPDMLEENIRMMNAVCHALASRPVDHVVYISSDAVYADSAEPLTEGSPMAPGSLHGVMHLARELMLAETVGETPLACLRPTLIYGADDPHNGYGPNRFRRQAAAGEDIVLFGAGEERRDHVHVDDVAELVARTVLHRSAGSLNIATGVVTSFHDLASLIAASAGDAVTVRGTPRQGPMPHDGYRAFDIAAAKAAFPDFAYTPVADGLARDMSASA